MNTKFGDRVFRIMFIMVFVMGMVGVPGTDVQAQDNPALQLDSTPEGWIANPANGHYYRLTGYASWQDAETQATNWGGHLVTVNDQEENDWLVSTFGSEQTVWIGYTDQYEEGNWGWANGETPGYTNWFQHLCGDWEPNDAGPDGEDYATFNYNGESVGCDGIPEGIPEIGPGKWNDISDASMRGIVELTSPPPNSTFGLISYWNFDEGSGLIASDSASVAYENTGTLVNGPQWVSSPFGNALSFDAGSDQYASTLNNNDSLSIPSGGITITVWVNAYDVSGVRNILAKDKEETTSRGNYSLAIVDGRLRFGFSEAPDPYDGENDYGDNWIDTTTSISPNRWYFVAVTHTYGNSNETAIYIDGVSQPLSEWQCDWGCDPNSMPATFPDPLYIGKSICNGEPIDGLIDEVRIYNGVLSPEEFEYTPLAVGSPDNPVKIFFMPTGDTQAIIDGGQVMADYLNQETGLNFEVNVPDSNADTVYGMCQNPDSSMGFIPGFGYVLASDFCGVGVSQKAIRFGWGNYWSEILVPRNSSIQTLNDLDGLDWSFPDYSSASGYMAPIVIFDNNGVNPASIIETGSHDQAVMALYNGDVDFATTFFSPPIKPDGEPAWQPSDDPDIPDAIVPSCDVSPDGSQLLCYDSVADDNWQVTDGRSLVRNDAPDVVQTIRILTISEPIANDALSFGPDFPTDLRTQIESAMVTFAGDPEWWDSIGNFYGWEGVTPAVDADYDFTRQMVATAGITLENWDGTPDYEPSFSARLAENQVHGYGWLIDSDVDLFIDGENFDTQTVVEAEWDPNQTFVMFDLGESPTLQAGQLIEMTDGKISKTHTVTNLDVTGIDPIADTVFGTADPGSLIFVGISPDNPGRNETADTSGNWTADYSVWGDEDWEQNTFDIQPGDRGEAAQCDEDGDCTQIEWYLPNPLVSVRLDGNTVTGYDWPMDTEITLMIDDLATGKTYYSDTGQMAEAPWGGEIIVYFELNDQYTVNPGDRVTMQGGSFSNSHIVFDGPSFDSADVEADTVSGSASVGASIQVNQCDENNCADRYIEGTTEESWTVDFSVKGPRDDEKVLRDLRPGMGGEIWQFDEWGNSTVRSWYIPNPIFGVRTNEDNIEGWEWPFDAAVTVTIDDPTTSEDPEPFYATVGVADWDPYQTYFSLHIGDYDLKTGDVVTVTDGNTTKELTITPFEITSFDLDTEMAYGEAGENQYVNVWTCWQDEPCVNRDETADQNGDWSTNFAIPGEQDWENETADLRSGSWIDSSVSDEDGDQIQFGVTVPTYTLHAVPTYPEVHGHDWAPGSDVTLIIDNDTNPDNGTLYEATRNVSNDPWCGEPCFDLNGVFDLQIGQYVTMTDGNVSKTVQVSMLTVTEVDYGNDILRGEADPGSRVAVNIWSQDGLARYVTTEPDGTWEADFSVFGDEDLEQFTTDIVPGDNGRAIQLNPDGSDDGTLEYWNISNPFIQVRANDDRIEGYEWPEGTAVTIEIDDPNPANPDYPAQEVTVGIAPWDPNQTYFELNLWDMFDIQPGFIVTATDGITIRKHTVVNLEFTDIDIDADIVTGKAVQDSQIDIWACKFNNCFNLNGVPVDEFGEWMADFQGIHDIQPGTWIDSIQYDEFGNGTMFGQTVEGAEIAGTIYALENVPGNEAGGVMVEACNTDQSVCHNALTDESGNYTIAYLPKGEFNIKAYPAGDELPGYSDLPVNITDYITYYAEDIVLPGPPTPPPSGAIEPSHEGGGTISIYIGDPLTLTANGCPSGTASFELIVLDDGYTRTGVMHETPLGSGVYTTTTPSLSPHHGVAKIVYTINCPDGRAEKTPFFIYIDPSGIVQTVSGIPIVGATVTLLRADNPDGPFEVVPDGSVVMSPSNRTNPDTTDEYGKYGWDVLTGFYIVRAEFPGCYSHTDPSQPFVESEVLTIPPPVSDLILELECPNLPPTGVTITAPVAPLPVHVPVTVQVDFADLDEGDTHTVEIDWGDMTTAYATVTGLTAVGEHQYQSTGVYTIEATVTDSYGETASATYQYVVIYAPDGGFVTGGGWIDSPEGAYTADPSLTGKATFGFVSKYQKGAKVPIGNTEFRFKAGNLNFYSSTYEWLVVNQGSANVQFKGSGTINGEPAPNNEEYRFMLWAGDGNSDTFRIKIWYEDGGTEVLVYDNGMNQSIGGGSIVVHNAK